METTTLIPALTAAILAISGVVWAYSFFFKPYYLLALSREAKETASELWWSAHRCEDPDVAERLFASAEEIDEYGDYIRDLRFSPKEFDWCVEKINCLDEIRANKPQYRTWEEVQADLGQAYMVLFMLWSLAIRHPLAIVFVLVNVSVLRFLRRYWKAIKQKLATDYQPSRVAKHA